MANDIHSNEKTNNNIMPWYMNQTRQKDSLSQINTTDSTIKFHFNSDKIYNLQTFKLSRKMLCQYYK